MWPKQNIHKVTKFTQKQLPITLCKCESKRNTELLAFAFNFSSNRKQERFLYNTNSMCI